MEIWKKHPRLKEIEVSSDGRVRTLDRVHHTERGQVRYKGKLIKLSNQYTGKGKSMYQKCHLSIPSTTQKNHWVHRLVAETFLPNPNNLKYVDHKDNNGLNNKVNNLQWVTNATNVNKSISEGNHKNINYYKGKSWNKISIELGSPNGHLVYRRMKRGWCIDCATSINTGNGKCSHEVI